MSNENYYNPLGKQLPMPDNALIKRGSFRCTEGELNDLLTKWERTIHLKELQDRIKQREANE